MAQKDGVITIYTSKLEQFDEVKMLMITHFETNILLLDLTNKTVLSISGWSKTDQLIINKLLRGLEIPFYHCRRSMGEVWMEYDGEKVEFAETIPLGRISNIKSYQYNFFINQLLYRYK